MTLALIGTIILSLVAGAAAGTAAYMQFWLILPAHRSFWAGYGLVVGITVTVMTAGLLAS